MFSYGLSFVALFALLASVAAFNMSPSRYMKSSSPSTTKLYEDFNLDFKNPTIVSSPLIFSEKQLREFTATYSVDERVSPLDFLFSFFKKKEDEEKPNGPSYASALKPTVSIAVLEEKTAQFVKGKTDAKAFYGVLSAAFGDKLNKVFPEILANLPADKASALKKVAK